jgi:hypothetical protein
VRLAFRRDSWATYPEAFALESHGNFNAAGAPQAPLAAAARNSSGIARWLAPRAAVPDQANREVLPVLRNFPLGGPNSLSLLETLQVRHEIPYANRRRRGGQ